MYQDELAQAKRRRAMERWKPTVAPMPVGWYRLASWWTFFLPLAAVLLYWFHFWVSPVLRIGYFHARKTTFFDPSSLDLPGGGHGLGHGV